MKAAVYYRVSSQAQQEKESIETQRMVLRLWLKEKGWEYTEFQDDGISGEELSKRPGFTSCIEALGKGQFQALVVFQPDRIGRFKPYRDRFRVMTVVTDNGIDVWSHDGIDDYYYNPNKPEDMFRLEQELIDARVRNYKQAKKIKAGKKRATLQGGFPGGPTPYGISYLLHDKETRRSTGKPGHFELVPAEHETLKAMFTKLQGGWSLAKVAYYLNQHPKRFPKRPRKYKGRLVTRWSENYLQQLVWNDLYFTGKIKPVSKDNGIPIDTDIRLFDQRFIEAVRAEVQVKAKTSKYTPYIDCLLQGIATCGVCGWRIGAERMFRKLVDGSPVVYRYYRCKGREKEGHCDFKITPAKKLDNLVWNAFVKKLTAPDEVTQLILSGQFALDKSDEAVRSELAQAKIDLGACQEETKALLYQHQKKYIDEDELDRRMSEVLARQQEAKGRREHLAQRLRQAKEVEEAVQLATRYLADQVKQMSAFQKALEGSKDKMLDAIQKILKTGGFFSVDLSNRPKVSKQSKAGKQTIKSLFAFEPEAFDMATSPELDRDQIENMIFQQKRALLQWFVDKDKGIVVNSPMGGSPEVNLSLQISSNLFNDFGDKKRKGKQSQREKHLEGNQLAPVAGSPHFFQRTDKKSENKRTYDNPQTRAEKIIPESHPG